MTQAQELKVITISTAAFRNALDSYTASRPGVERLGIRKIMEEAAPVLNPETLTLQLTAPAVAYEHPDVPGVIFLVIDQKIKDNLVERTFIGMRNAVPRPKPKFKTDLAKQLHDVIEDLSDVRTTILYKDELAEQLTVIERCVERTKYVLNEVNKRGIC